MGQAGDVQSELKQAEFIIEFESGGQKIKHTGLTPMKVRNLYVKSGVSR